MKHVITAGDRYGRLTVIREVRKISPAGRPYRAALCRCDCGVERAPAITALAAGDVKSCGCGRRERAVYEQKRCAACGELAMIRRDQRACSRACGYVLTGAALRSEDPSDDVLHHRVRKARGPASGHACVDCGGAAEDWSTVDPSSDDVWVRFQPRCRKCHRRYDGAVGEGHPPERPSGQPRAGVSRAQSLATRAGAALKTISSFQHFISSLHSRMK